MNLLKNGWKYLKKPPSQSLRREFLISTLFGNPSKRKGGYTLQAKKKLESLQKFRTKPRS